MKDLALQHWLNETAAYGLSISRRVIQTQSRHQRIEIVDTPALGRVLLLDGRPMTATGDEFIYHECMVHPSALTHPAPRRALILGGGDGAAARELLKHPGIEEIVVAELDAAVVALARQCLPQVHRGALDDPRVSLVIGDAADFVSEQLALREPARFDLVIFDLTPPDSPARGLFTPAFFAQLKQILTPQALISLHLGAPFFQQAQVRQLVDVLRLAFRHVAISTAGIPLYGGLWAMAVASDASDPKALPLCLLADRFAERRLHDLRYYHPALHAALFSLPQYIQDLLDA
jgi:spermidine synthase